MNDWDTESNVAENVPAVEKRRLLLGFMNKSEAIRRLQSSRIVATPADSMDHTAADRTDSETAYGKLWKDAKDSIDSSDSFGSSDVVLEDIPDEEGIRDHIDAFVNDPHFQASRGDHPEDSWDIKMVPIEQLVTFQPAVTKTAYLTDLSATTGSIADLLKFALPVDAAPLVEDQRIRDTFFSGWQFVTRSPNVHLSGPHYSRSATDDDTVLATVTFELKSNPNFVYVAHFEDRYILKNGNHRVYQLLRAGETHVPAVVIEAETYDETGANQSGFFDRGLVMGDRPPLLIDYETPIAVTIDRRATNRVVRLIAETTDIFR